ncbi:related to antiviral protein and putative helicase [Cephalotrichum gorgonifer]|uniref:Related to antiviral protein and putative helicase n=1 Tax=Cephalotrichum gorgonifer TaxID=2041049 RepID=A0AAE8SVP4_9PEZI|nr:related to antiviral protein and putative helicase [Cephalotrichum gorgonifer]
MLTWYRSLVSHKVDVVGDFAGKELFVIHGDSILLHCLGSAKVDYDHGFQLLHAIYAVEAFLDNLERRGCRFNIVWFDNEEDLCVPPSAKNPEPYLLTRAIIIKHFARHNELSESGKLSFQFSEVDTAEYGQYLKDNAVHFFLCLDGYTSFGDEKDPRGMRYLELAYSHGLRGYNVAFLDTLELVYVSVVTPSIVTCDEIKGQKEPRPERSSFKRISDLEQGEELLEDGLSPWGNKALLTSRDVVSLTTLCNILMNDSSAASRRVIAAYLVHIAIIRVSDLSQRSLDVASLGPEDETLLEEFIISFSRISIGVLEGNDKLLSDLEWDVSDLIDGRILRCVLPQLEKLQIPGSLMTGIHRFANGLQILTGVDVSEYLPAASAERIVVGARDVAPQGNNQTSVLPFTNPVIESYLEDVSVDTVDAPGLGTTDKVFQDITHWLNAKNPVDVKYQAPKPRGFFARKRNQKYMADTIAYSASLTNSSGKVITPETIVVTRSEPEQKSQKQKVIQQAKPSTSGKPGSIRNAQKAKGGRESAKEESSKIEQAKRDSRAKGAVLAWQSRCSEFEGEHNLVKRFMKVTRYISNLAAIDSATVGAEASLYAINALAKILLKEQTGKGNMSQSEFDIFALIWKMVLEMRSASVSRVAAKEYTITANAVGLPITFTPDSLQERALPFFSVLSDRLPEIKLSMEPLEFQLKYCGPYLDRGFNPMADPRVRFTPDAWQRKVLDCIDADKSLLVVAPTSSGKTFISFYAMKKILQSNDDDVLVYVAPTKALVNQIAAEIQAEFSKTYKQPAKSVWAIHTRDYRVNNSTGCQILVTVPHILEIMLLAPSNSKAPNSWARRVKKIIFDEVHCIGQAEDGVIWEHLLLLAPCPIIALSATVGNPTEFKNWLEEAQKTKGSDLEMVVHTSRYSDLRKFIYFPPKKYTFEGLKSSGRLPIPGLDRTANERGSRFRFIHPIASLTNRSRATLDDIGLEPRDCFELWQCMMKHQTESYPVGDALHPREFVDRIARKADVVAWGAALKDVLLTWMRDLDSPFSNVQQALRESIAEPESLAAGTAGESTGSGTTFEVDDDDLSSSALPLLNDLNRQGALPALLFSYDRECCENTAFDILERLETAENAWKESSPEWAAKMAEYESWKKNAARRGKAFRQQAKAEAGSKMDLVREAASREVAPMASFDPEAPVPQFSFADHSKLLSSELDKHVQTLKWLNLNPKLVAGLRRGIGVHHAGMNRAYRQVVEMLFRKGFLSVVLATGTLALGINMPCKTVVFFGDTVFLTALNYQQAAGRSGRRGFDPLGNVVFTGMKRDRAFEIMASRLPDLQGHFPLTTTLILRLLGLLHHTDNSEYAVKAIQSMLSQSRLYLGGPSDQIAIKHHVRFSIEYLRRQNLINQGGAPLNFAGLVGNLYFTDNSVFAFHALLKEGYFYQLCRDFRQKPDEVLQELVLTLSHLFCRIPVRNYRDENFIENIVQRSTSTVLLPELPGAADQILRKHNAETLDIFAYYVSTFVHQHLCDTQDDTLPFTKQKVRPQQKAEYDAGSILGSLPSTKLRSPFVALSGFTDSFDSIHDLCATTRSGVFLEESVIPYIPIYPQDTAGVPWNSYILDFFKHGNLQALVNDNQIKASDVWFHLKDFSLVLATVVTSLTNFFSQEAMADDSMVDIQDVGDVMDEEEDDVEALGPVAARPVVQAAATERVVPVAKKTPRKAVVADSWEDEDESSESGESAMSNESESKEANVFSTDSRTGKIEDNELMLVLTAFKKLQEEFDEKFRKVWA